MSKIYGHTKTLFIEGGKFKWARHYEHCIECWTCNSKYKGNWLCTKCYDKKRYKNPKRKQINYKAAMKWHRKNYKPVIERKKRISTFNKKEYQKKWYEENKQLISYINKWKKINWLEVIFNKKTIKMPFHTLEKPKCTTDPKYGKWKENMKIYLLLKNKYD